MYYKGTSYQVEREVRIDTDEDSSVHTSEDEYIVDDHAVTASLQDVYKRKSKLRQSEEDEALN